VAGLLKDALVSVMVLSMICMIVSTSIYTHVQINAKMKEQVQYQQDDFNDFFEELEICKESIEQTEPY
jgi:hypothetical protein